MVKKVNIDNEEVSIKFPLSGKTKKIFHLINVIKNKFGKVIYSIVCLW